MALTVTTRNARFQQWQALLGNRTKRHRAGEFIVHGVRPISMAVSHGWLVRELLYRREARLSDWATELLEAVSTNRVAVAGELLHELSERTEAPPELLAVVAMPADELGRIPIDPRSLLVVCDRPASPGNLGTLIRSADAFGACGVVVSGHAVDVYDPRVVRASTGSVFAVPTVRVAGPQPVREWLAARRPGERSLRLVGTDEHGPVELAEADLTGPIGLLVGNESGGLSAAWRESCDELVRIPITGAASSLNAATAGSIALYEASRQRRHRYS